MQVNSVEAIIDDERLACNFWGVWFGIPGLTRTPEHPWKPSLLFLSGKALGLRICHKCPSGVKLGTGAILMTLFVFAVSTVTKFCGLLAWLPLLLLRPGLQQDYQPQTRTTTLLVFLGSWVVPFCPFWFRAPLLKPNSRKTRNLGFNLSSHSKEGILLTIDSYLW